MRCTDCKFFSRHTNTDPRYEGSCHIYLPPHARGVGNYVQSNLLQRGSSCSLGQPIRRRRIDDKEN